MTQELPKVLIVSRGVWDDNGTSSTLSSIFEGYDPSRLAQIYIETKKPNTRYCSTFFQISEFSLVKKLVHWKLTTGKEIHATYSEDTDTAHKEEAVMSYVRGHRSYFYTLLREFLWGLNGWKSKELKNFIRDFNPDVVWLTGSPLIFMNRLSRYVVKHAHCPYCIYEMDDVYSYRNCGKNPLKLLYRFRLRQLVKKLIQRSSQLFVISPKMKREFDKIFKVGSQVLTKGIDYSCISYKKHECGQPLHMVYMGQVIYGRLSTLQKLGQALDKFNVGGTKIILDVYTSNVIDETLKTSMAQHGSVIFHQSVPYSQVTEVIEKSDIVLFVESFEKQYANVARLSFSTKITDYLQSGKCVFAMGPRHIAPMEYFIENDAAVVVTDENEIQSQLERLMSQAVIDVYSSRAFECGKRNHDKIKLQQSVYDTIKEISK